MGALAFSGAGIVIVGGGHAGFQCVDSLVKGGYGGKITLIDADRYPPYQKPPLSKDYLLGDADSSRLLFRTPSFYEQHGIELRIGCSVVAIDRTEQTVKLDNGERLAYAQLVLALGSRIRRLEVGDDLAGEVCYIKTLDDIDLIRARLQTAQRVVVIGGGYNGLEFASAAAKLGKSVRVLVRGKRVLAQSLAPELSAYLQEQHRRHGVDICTGCAIQSIVRHGGGGLRITDGTGQHHAADLLVAGIGATPESSLAQMAGLDCDDGILVDGCCRTSDPHIYAAGDVVRFRHPLLGRYVRLESVQNAVAQAKVIASNLLGNDREHDEVPWFWSDQYEIKLQMAGLHEGYDQMVWRGDREEGRFSLFYYRAGDLIAVHSVNKPADHMVARKLIAGRISVTPAQAADVSFRLNDLMSVPATARRGRVGPLAISVASLPSAG